MNRRKQSYWISALLALLLATGPLQAQVLYACTMMDTAMHDECCCDDYDDCADSNCGDSINADETPCCERTVELTKDGEAPQAVVPAKQKAEIKSNVDPSASSIANSELTTAPRVPSAVSNYPPSDYPVTPGSDTYLITQRLRI